MFWDAVGVGLFTPFLILAAVHFLGSAILVFREYERGVVFTLGHFERVIRAVTRQAEAERERRAQVIHAEGEVQASEKLFQAARILAHEP